MSIGATIKKLRHEQDMTQEQLADFLGVSIGSVSQWECNRTAPDISQLPLLARIFHVSTDVLLEIDIGTQEKDIEDIIIRAAKCSRDEAISIYRQALQEYPAAYELMLHLSDALAIGTSDTEEDRLKERISLLEKIRECAKDPYCQNASCGRLCGIYMRIGEPKAAKRIVESVPPMQYSRQELDAIVLRGIERIYENHHRIHNEFASLCDDIYEYSMMKVDGKPFFSHKEAIIMLEKIPKLFDVFYENGDYCGKYGDLARAYTRLAELYADIKDEVNTINNMKSAYACAEKTDGFYAGLHGMYVFNDSAASENCPELPFEKRHSSILAKPELDYSTATLCIDSENCNACNEVVKAFAEKRFDFVREKIPYLN